MALVSSSVTSTGQRRSIKVTPVCEDSAGGLHIGKSWKVDPVEFSQM
jgi:hypothetical protein